MARKNNKQPAKKARGKKTETPESESEGKNGNGFPDQTNLAVIDIFADPKDSTLEKAHAALNRMAAARDHRTTSFARVDQIERSGTSLPHFYWRYLFGMCGIPNHCMIDIIGAENLGKTTLGLTILSWAILSQNAFCLWVETEGKPLLNTQIMRIMHPEPGKALTMMHKALSFREAHTELEMAEIVIDWIMVMRGHKTRGKGNGVIVPLRQPLYVFVDTFSKLTPAKESAGEYFYGDNMKEAGVKDRKDIGEGSNMGPSKFSHEWTRRMTGIISQNNVTLIQSHHQNDDIDMTGGKNFSFLPKSYTELFNKRKLGGRATNQSAAFQIVMANNGIVKDASNSDVGRRVRIRLDKNSYAQHGRVIDYELYTKYNRDEPGVNLEPVIQLDNPFLTWLMKDGLMDLQVINGLWSYPSIGAFNLPAWQLVPYLQQDNEITMRLGRMFHIEGYYSAEAEWREMQARALAATP